MKKNATRYCWPCLLQDAQQTFYCSKQTGGSSTKTITHHFFVSIGPAIDAAKICGGAENVVKTETPANIRKWIARFYYFRHLYSLEARVYCSQ